MIMWRGHGPELPDPSAALHWHILRKYMYQLKHAASTQAYDMYNIPALSYFTAESMHDRRMYVVVCSGHAVSCAHDIRPLLPSHARQYTVLLTILSKCHANLLDSIL